MQQRTISGTVRLQWSHSIQIIGGKKDSWFVVSDVFSQASQYKAGRIWRASMSVIVQPCVNSTWRECMYAARLVLMCVCVCGGGTPYRLSVLTYGGGDECVHVSSEKERWNGKNEKWNKMEVEGDRGRGREGHWERNVQLVLVATIFTHRLCSLVSVTSVFSVKPQDEYVDYSALVMYTIRRE